MEIESYFTDFYQFWIGAVVGLLVLSYVYLTWEYDFWKRQGVPGDKPRLFMGTLRPTWKYNLADQDVDAMKKYGHVHGGFVARSPVLFVSDPELIRQILVKDFPSFSCRMMISNIEKDELLGNMLSVMNGEKWKMVRSTLTPTYTTGKLKQMITLIEECVNNLTKSLKTQAENGEPIEFTRKFPVLTLDVIASCAFGVKTGCVDNSETEFVRNATKAFRGNAKLIYFTLILPFLSRFSTKFIRNPFRYFTTIAKQTIDIRLKNKDFSRRDFLQIMLEAEIPSEETETKENQTNAPKKTLSREIIIAQTVLFILAGHEATANTLYFMAYELAQNKDVQEKLIKEVDEAMANSDDKLTYEAIASMQYLHMVMSETLRKYPPAVRLDRVCCDDEYNLNGIILNKKVSIAVPVYAMHHNAEYFPNPSVFDPERFSPENKAKRNPFTYLPFGAGPRNCIAMRFALMEMKLVMAYMLSNYRFQSCSETEYPLKLRTGANLMQAESVKLVLQNREHRTT